MVTAGVYMIARLSFLFSLSPTAGGVVAFVGALTALFAATIGFFQYDIKKVLAYSTVSQLGFMFIGVGVGAYWAGVFHLMTHAFFKACLFLGSGSVIHGMHAVEHDEVAVQDMRNMGGLKRVMPITARTYQIACLAITAAPIPFFAGFWSKDEILWKAFGTMNTGSVPGVLIYLMGLSAALGTSFYMWRSYYLTFEGPHARKEIATKVHESPAAITYVLIVLAFLSTVAGALFGFGTHFIGGHGEPLLNTWLHPTLAHAQASFKPYGLGLEYALMGVSVGGAIAMWALARSRYGEKRSPNWAANEQRLPGFNLLSNKYFVDEIYHATIVRAFLWTRIVFAEMDRWIVDGIVNAFSVGARAGLLGHVRDRRVHRRRRGQLRRRGHADGGKQAPHAPDRARAELRLRSARRRRLLQHYSVLPKVKRLPPHAPSSESRGDVMSIVHKTQAKKLWTSLILALGLVLGLSGSAVAQSAEQGGAHGQIVVRPEKGRGSLELAPRARASRDRSSSRTWAAGRSTSRRWRSERRRPTRASPRGCRSRSRAAGRRPRWGRASRRGPSSAGRPRASGRASSTGT
jgi:hypothetical protein